MTELTAATLTATTVLAPGVHRKEVTLRAQLQTTSGIIWQRGQPDVAGTIEVATAISAHHAQVELKPPLVSSSNTTLIPTNPIALPHYVLLENQQRCERWWLSVIEQVVQVKLSRPVPPSRLSRVNQWARSQLKAIYHGVESGWRQIRYSICQNCLWWQLTIERPLAATFRLTGLLAMGSAIALFLLFAGPIIILESQSLVVRGAAALPTWLVPTKPPIAAAPTPTPMPEITSQTDQFSLRIPDLNISSVVIPNVDIYDSKIYLAALKEGIAQAKGSGFPGQMEHNRTIFLFAHSTDSPLNILKYNAQFFALKDAKIGQAVIVRFWGRDYTYTITEKRIVEATDTSFLIPQTDREQLVLQTCWPPGTSDKRLLIIAVPSDNG